MTAPQKLLTPAEVATWIGMSERQLRRLRSRGEGPQVTRAGYRTIRYTRNDVIAYLVACRARTSGRP